MDNIIIINNILNNMKKPIKVHYNKILYKMIG